MQNQLDSNPDSKCDVEAASNMPAELTRAIESYDEVLNRASRLLSKILEGQEPPQSDGSDCTAPSLNQILINGPKQLNACHDRMVSILNDIDSALF